MSSRYELYPKYPVANSAAAENNIPHRITVFFLPSVVAIVLIAACLSAAISGTAENACIANDQEYAAAIAKRESIVSELLSKKAQSPGSIYRTALVVLSKKAIDFARIGGAEYSMAIPQAASSATAAARGANIIP